MHIILCGNIVEVGGLEPPTYAGYRIYSSAPILFEHHFNMSGRLGSNQRTRDSKSRPYNHLWNYPIKQKKASTFIETF